MIHTPKENDMSAVAERKPPRAAPKAKTPSLGAQVDTLWELREQKKALTAQVSELDERIAGAEDALLQAMGEQGLDKLTGRNATASSTRSTTASVEDWDSFYAYIHKNRYYHLLQRRVSDPAYRELLEAGKKVPGVQPFIKTRLNLRTV